MNNKKSRKPSYLLISLFVLAALLIILICFLLYRQHNTMKQTASTGKQSQMADASIQGPLQEKQIEDGFTSDSSESTSDSQNSFFGPSQSDIQSDNKSDDSGKTTSDTPDSGKKSQQSKESEVMGPAQLTQAPETDSTSDSENNSEKTNTSGKNNSSKKNTTSEKNSNPEKDSTSGKNSDQGTISPSHGNSAFDDKSDETLDTVITQVRSSLPAGNGSWSVYICDLSSGAESTINDAPMQAASLIKLYIMGAVYENYDTLSQQYSSATLDTYLNSMITVSDNDAANSLISCLGSGDSTAGMQKVNNFCQAHGYTSTSMGRLLLASKETGDNYTSAYDCGKFLKEIYQICAGTTQTPSLTHAQEMYTLLKQQQRTNKIPAALPEGVHVANKTGELSDVENDAGILYDTAKGKNLVICFMSENLGSAADAQNTIAQLSRTIYLAYNG